MPEVDAHSLVDQLIRIGLVSREQYRQAMAEAEDSSGEVLIRVLMRKGWITSWQLERLKKNDPSSFFYGDYRALFHLAEGTFARVYRGRHDLTGSPVAIKVLRHRFATMNESVKRFHKEAQAGMRLRPSQHRPVARPGPARQPSFHDHGIRRRNEPSRVPQAAGAAQ